jgi:integrase/recombinase XerC
MLVPRTPILYKHRKRWNLIFYDPATQRQKWLALGTGDKAAAERRAKPIVQAYERQEFNPWRDTWSSGTPILAALDAFTARPDLKDRSRDNAAYLVRRLARAMPSGSTLEMVTDADVRRIVLAPSSVDGKHSYRRTLAAFFSWCMKRGLGADNPASRIVLPKKIRRSPRFLTRAQAVHLLRTETDPEIQSLIRFALGSGLRRGELVTLRRADVSAERGTITVRGEITKGYADRIVPLGAWARQAVEGRPDHGVLWPLRGEHASKRVKRSLTAAGLGAFNLHSLRHTFASWLRIGGAPLDRIQYWLGHRSITTTEIYAHLQPEAVLGEFEVAFSGPALGPLLESAESVDTSP